MVVRGARARGVGSGGVFHMPWAGSSAGSQIGTRRELDTDLRYVYHLRAQVQHF